MIQDQDITTRIVDKQFVLYLISTIIYSSCYWNIFWNVPPGHIAKVFIGLLMIISEMLLLIVSVKTARLQWADIASTIRMIMIFIILYNIVHIVYAAVLDSNVEYTSLLGNPLFQPAFMLPFVMLVGFSVENIFSLVKGFWYYLVVILIISLLRRAINLFDGMFIFYMLALLSYMSSKKRFVILLFALVYMYQSFMVDGRMAVVRILAGVAIWLFSSTNLYANKSILKIIFAIAVITPIYFLGVFLQTGSSVFEQANVTSRVSRLGADNTGDTRTFLYEEVFEDLSENNAWLLGKGVNGTYYSEFFDTEKNAADAANRIAEVGFLDFLLKGGLVQTIVYMILLLWGVHNCLFRSESMFMVLIGLILLVHYVALFIEDVPRYDLYNISMWLILGAAFSPACLECEEYFFREQFNKLFLK